MDSKNTSRRQFVQMATVTALALRHGLLPARPVEARPVEARPVPAQPTAARPTAAEPDSGADAGDCALPGVGGLGRLGRGGLGRQQAVA